MNLHEYLLDAGYKVVKALNFEDVKWHAEAEHVSKNPLVTMLVGGSLVPEAIKELRGHKRQYVLYAKPKED